MKIRIFRKDGVTEVEATEVEGKPGTYATSDPVGMLQPGDFIEFEGAPAPFTVELQAFAPPPEDRWFDIGQPGELNLEGDGD